MILAQSVYQTRSGCVFELSCQLCIYIKRRNDSEHCEFDPIVALLHLGQSFIDAQDDLSVTEYMRQYGMPERINDEVFIAMAKALDFIDPDKLSMTVVLTAMNRFLNEENGLQMAFLDGNQPERLCAPMVEHVRQGGGEVRLSSPVREIVTCPHTGEVKHLLLRSGGFFVLVGAALRDAAFIQRVLPLCTFWYHSVP
jgi:uncharacterized protein with NAD-binding domain and iron-sulfur cluster